MKHELWAFGGSSNSRVRVEGEEVPLAKQWLGGSVVRDFFLVSDSSRCLKFCFFDNLAIEVRSRNSRLGLNFIYYLSFKKPLSPKVRASIFRKLLKSAGRYETKL